MRQTIHSNRRFFPGIIKTWWFPICLTFAPVVSHAVVTVGISDGTFTPANWSQFFSSSAPGTTAGFSQVASSGNPGSFGRIDLNIPNAGNSYLVTYFTGQSYSPVSQGPILAIDFAADFKAVTHGDIFFGFKQGSAYYFLTPPPFTDINSTSWSHVSYTGNTQSMFGDIFSYAPPNFTNGDPLQFGIYMGYTTTGTGTAPFSIGVDNFPGHRDRCS